MPSKLTSDYENRDGFYVLTIYKKRGKLTLEEIENYLRYENQGRSQGHYLIHLNCSESTCGGSGWMDDEVSPGDSAELYQYNFDDTCPICRKLAPIEYCPACGEHLPLLSESMSRLDDCITAEFVSVLKQGDAVIKPCEVNLTSHEIYIQKSQDAKFPGSAIERQYIVINGKHIRACHKTDAASSDFWYE